MPIHSPGKCNLPSGTGTNLLGEPGPETRGPRTPGTEKAELDTATGVLAPPLPGPETDNIQFFYFFKDRFSALEGLYFSIIYKYRYYIQYR